MQEPVLGEQSARNRDSREAWQRYAAHRRNVDSLLLPLARPGARLLLVGAGNCNDVDLNQLRQRYAEIHLADLDGEALQWGLRHQGLLGSPQFVTHAGVELTGIASFCARWRGAAPPAAAELEQALAAAQSHRWDFSDGSAAPVFDVVASVGLLSQLIESVVLALPAGHPGFLGLVTALRNAHLRLLMQAVRPGGCAVLVSDVVSSDSCPALKTTSPAALPELLRRAVEAHDFFTGLNPGVLHALWKQDPQLAPLTEKVMVARPWLWDFGPRLYACCAYAAVRRQAAV